MDVVFAQGQATATDVLAKLPDAPTRTAVRTFLRILEEKGHLKHSKNGREFVYRPTHRRERAGQSALQRVLKIFFDGSLEKALAAHLADPGAEISEVELERLSALVRQARQKEK